MATKTISVIIPTYNMCDYLPALWDSFTSSGVIDVVNEIIFVDDASTDQTAEAISHFPQEKVRLLRFPTNQGRYRARLKGAEAAMGTHLLFFDSRMTPGSRYGEFLIQLLQKHEALMSVPTIDISKSVYNLYWQRTHEVIFARNYRDSKAGFYLTHENYDQYAKGTGAFLCPKNLFLQACRKFEGQTVLSDDTFLMAEITKTQPIWVQDTLSAGWEPRQSYWPFMLRLWERGPGFVEYHVFEKRGLYFYLFVMWLLAVIGTLSVLMIAPVNGLMILGAELGALAMTTALFANSPLEFVRMLPVHVSTVLFYGFGSIYGLGFQILKFRR